MSRVSPKWFAFFQAFILLGCSAFGQNLLVTDRQNATETYSIDSIAKHTFAPPFTLVYFKNGASVSFPLDELRNMRYRLEHDTGSIFPAIKTAGAIDLQIRPNPTNLRAAISFGNPEKETAVALIEIFLPDGRLVYQLEKQVEADKRIEIFWDLADNRGSSMSAGVYLVVVSFGRKKMTKQLVIP